MNGAVKVLCCAVGLLLLVSCAGLLGYGKTEANLMKNVTAFWTAKMNGEWGLLTIWPRRNSRDKCPG